MFLRLDYASEAMAKARDLICPECNCSGCLQHPSPDDSDYVCSNCDFWGDMDDLECEWLRVYADEYGYTSISEEEGDAPDDYIEV